MTRSAGAAIGRAVARLTQGDVAAPRREALQILSALPGGPSAVDLLDPSQQLSDAALAAFDAAVDRRAAGEPLCYVTGRAGFRHLDLLSDHRALIPRPETEGLVDRILARVASGTVADIGTGSGCVALSLASEGRYDAVVAVDVSAAALNLARANAARLGAPIRLVMGDMTAALADNSCDALASNPPYLSDAEYAALDRGVRDWEPELALASGADGLAATDSLLRDGRRVVRVGGWIALEVDCSRAAEAARRAVALGWRDVAVDTDLFGRERYLIARRSQR